MGPAGPMGATGAVGPKGKSLPGIVGPVGSVGSPGPRGAVGEVGPVGPALVGPSGPAGKPGPAGPRGQTGDTGPEGATTPGLVGPMGVPGPTGEVGPQGPAGAQGRPGVVACWDAFRDVWFDAKVADIHDSETAKIAEVAAFLKNNPTLEAGIDGSLPARGSDPRDEGLASRRVNAIRDALINAGVPAEKIKTGTFGDPRLRRDRRVEILIRTTP
ncbi:MAG: OmpA family protein [Planctomycetota bacterium]|nr:OmpA family protein [Planctomycetota bacterium]